MSRPASMSQWETCYVCDAELYPRDDMTFCLTCNDLVQTCLHNHCLACGENTSVA